MGTFELLTRERRMGFFIFANCVFMILGVISLAAGVWLYLEKNDFLELTPTSYSALSAAGLCAFSGATIAIISAVGCISMTLQGRCLLITYLSFIVLLIVIQAVTGITGFFYKESSQEMIRTNLLGNINRTTAFTRAGREVNLTISWDHLHETLECCGVNGPTDWFKTIQWPRNDFVPDSCCNVSFFDGKYENMRNCGKMTQKRNIWYQEGCYKTFASWLHHHVHIVSTISIILLIAEVVVLVAGIVVCLSKDDHVHHPRSGSTAYRYTKGEGGEGEKLSPVNSCHSA